MRPVANKINPSETEPWLEPIGKLITNFGAIELHTYWWLNALSNSPDTSKQFLKKKKPFKQRVERIIVFLDGLASKPLKTKAITAWEQALDLAKFRNSIAHSPLVFYRPHDGSDSLVMVADVSRLNQTVENLEPLSTLEQLNSKIDSLVALANTLTKLLEEIDKM
jgi:hypothetical protein